MPTEETPITGTQEFRVNNKINIKKILFINF